METDRHDTFRHLIDKTLMGRASLQEEQSLREHLQACAPCQEYLHAGSRVIAGLGGFSFEVNPQLHAKVRASLAVRAQQLQERQFSRRRMAWACIIALLLTAAGSFIDLQFGSLAAAVFGVQPMLVWQGLLTFCIWPSLCLSLLLPILPMLSAGCTNRSCTNQKGSLL